MAGWSQASSPPNSMWPVPISLPKAMAFATDPAQTICARRVLQVLQGVIKHSIAYFCIG